MRLFVAINLPADVRDALYAAAAPLRETGVPVKWVAPDAMHLTLKFLGDVADDRERAIAGALDALCAGRRPFTLPLEGFGAFPTSQRPRVFWAGAEAVPPLELLQHDLERALAGLDFPLEGRPFRPHLTLGRAKQGAERSAGAAGALLDDLQFAGEIAVDTVDLMESHLSPKGATYTVRHAARLVDA